MAYNINVLESTEYFENERLLKMTLTKYQEERLYHLECRKKAIELLKRIGAKHIIYGIDKDFTGWENEMKKFFDDESFNEYLAKVNEKHGNVCYYAVHAQN